jgi:hypothetical protein
MLNLSRHSGQAGESLSLTLIRLWRKREREFLSLSLSPLSKAKGDLVGVLDSRFRGKGG